MRMWLSPVLTLSVVAVGCAATPAEDTKTTGQADTTQPVTCDDTFSRDLESFELQGTRTSTTGEVTPVTLRLKARGMSNWFRGTEQDFDTDWQTYDDFEAELVGAFRIPHGTMGGDTFASIGQMPDFGWAQVVRLHRYDNGYGGSQAFEEYFDVHSTPDGRALQGTWTVQKYLSGWGWRTTDSWDVTISLSPPLCPKALHVPPR